MKKIFLVIIAVVVVISVISLSFAAEGTSSAAKGTSSTKVVAYYFHGTFRCPTCTKMERYSRKAIEANFKKAIASGNLKFKTVNVEDRGNEHFVNDYQLYTKSLILSLVKDGKEVRHKNLDKIWELVRNKQKFMDYVVGEINGFMKDVQ